MSATISDDAAQESHFDSNKPTAGDEDLLNIYWKPSNTIISSFPLPQELKDEIYNYLLDGETVKYTPVYGIEVPRIESYVDKNGSAHTYEFDTSIFRVSKTIAKEATAYFAKINTFVLIRYDMPGFKYSLHHLGVPIVADHGLQDFKSHALFLELQWGDNPAVVVANEQERGCPREKGDLLLLLQDLPLFLRAMRFLCQYALFGAPYVGSKIGMRVEARVPPQITPFPQLSISLIHEHKALRLCEQKRILDALRMVTGSGRKLTLNGFEYAVQSTTAITDPGIIWLRAVQWDRIDVMGELKEQADSLAQAGQCEAAVARYHYLLEFFYMTGGQRMFQIDMQTDPGLFEAFRCWIHLGFDLQISTIALHMRMHNLEEAREHFSVLRELVPWNMLPREMTGACRHLLALFTLEKSMRDGRVAKNALIVVWNKLSELEANNDYAAHDFTAIDEALQANAELRPDALIIFDISRLSIHSLPLRAFNFHKELDAHTRPAGLVGWQDMAHLAALTDEDKEKINKVQKEKGLTISTFDAAGMVPVGGDGKLCERIEMRTGWLQMVKQKRLEVAAEIEIRIVH